MFLTVITPFYNNYVEVKKCIECLEKQTNKNFEWILIDDASENTVSKAVSKIILASQLNIRLLRNKENLGPGYSRNRGLEEAEGKYILFLDSDDYFENNAFELLYQTTSIEQMDCVIFDFFLVKEKKKKKKTLDHRTAVRIKKTEALLFTSGSVCGKMYYLDVIIKNKIRFPSLFMKEDMVFNKLALSCCDKISYIKKPLYNYVTHEGSLMASARAIDENYDRKAFIILEEKLKVDLDILEALFVKELLYAGVLHMFCKEDNIQDIKKFISEGTIKYSSWYKNPYRSSMPLRMKLLLFGVRYEVWDLLKFMAQIKMRGFKSGGKDNV